MDKAEMLLMTVCAVFALSAAVLRTANAKKLTHSRSYDNTGKGPRQSRFGGGSG
jgi:hypothetical protein